jgi:hypothetical protein
MRSRSKAVRDERDRNQAAIDLDVIAWANKGPRTLPYPKHATIDERETVNEHS